jgi:asparagine synthase (glutamine-hydrolysing)
MKDGLNDVGMAFILPFLEEIARRWGPRSLMLTGDGGDKVFPDLRPPRRIRSMDDLVAAVVEDAVVTPAPQVEALLGLPAGSLVDDLRARLEAYPEEDLAQRAVRFQIAERGRKWLFEGEDRGRSFAWQASPFYALPLFEAALAIPDRHKTDYRLYAAVQRELDPRLTQIAHADFAMSIDSRRYRTRAVARRWVLRTLGPVGRPLVRRLRPDRSDHAVLRSDTFAKLDHAVRADSKLVRMVLQAEAATAIQLATGRALQTWRTVLLVDRLWNERL